MEREVLLNKYGNGLIAVKTKKLKLNFKKVENVITIIEQNHSEMMPEEARNEKLEMRAERKERFERARKAFYKIRADIAKQNLPEMTLDEVNEEIAKMREEMEVERRSKE